jgi:hypothetical protein
VCLLVVVLLDVETADNGGDHEFFEDVFLLDKSFKVLFNLLFYQEGTGSTLDCVCVLCLIGVIVFMDKRVFS